MTDEPWGCCIAIYGAIFALGLCGGIGVGIRYERRQAVEAGVAEWRVDAKTAETSFHYREAKP